MRSSISHLKHVYWLQKLSNASLRFQMLKAFMQNPDVSSIDIEEKYHSWAAQERKDRYMTVRSLLWTLNVKQEQLQPTARSGNCAPAQEDVRKIIGGQRVHQILDQRPLGKSTLFGV